MVIDAQTRGLDREFQMAVAQYESGHFPEAAHAGDLVREAPESFEIHECWAWSTPRNRRTRKPVRTSRSAVQLKPDSRAARTNLAANLMRLGKAELAGVQFTKAVELEPRNYDTNHNLGEFYIRAGKVAKPLPFSSGLRKSILLLTTTATICPWPTLTGKLQMPGNWCTTS